MHDGITGISPQKHHQIKGNYKDIIRTLELSMNLSVRGELT